MKQPDNSPTLTHGAPTPQQQPRASKRRGLSKAERCSLLVFTLEWAAAGCAGVQKRPEPGVACPEESLKAMEQELGWPAGNDGPEIFIDVTKGGLIGHPFQPDNYAVFEDGPVIGALFDSEGKAPAGTRLEGHLWTTGDRIYGRYVRATLPTGRTVPICLELEKEEDRVGLPKEAGSKPGQAVHHKTARTRFVEEWR